MKNFFKFFFGCFKEGRSLILKYIAAGFTTAAITIFANKLELDSITYFNAVVSITAFTIILAFGVTCAVGIFINHNADENNKKRYIKMGFFLTLCIATVIFFLLFIFKDFILQKMLNITIEADLFYYAMITYFLIDCFNSYYVDLFKVTKKYLYQLLDFICVAILQVGGLFIFYLTNNLNLTNIGFMYLIISIINFICLTFIVNTQYKLNILDLTNIKMTKKEFHTFVYSIALQSVWQVGYTLLSYYMLKINDGIFNTYSYFENTLDVLIGLFYTFANIGLLRIETLIGKGDTEEAYKTGKYCIYSTMLIWCIYMVIILCLYNYILKGLNPELIAIGKETLIMYACLNFVRFLSWEITSYILIAGGWVKLQVMLHGGAMIYYLILFIAAPFTISTLGVYITVFLESFVIVILSLIIFMKKKWLTISYK